MTEPRPFDREFLIQAPELRLRFQSPAPRRALSYANVGGDFNAWRDRCKAKLAELIGLREAAPGEVTELRTADAGGVTITALTMAVSEDLSLPAYLLMLRSLPRSLVRRTKLWRQTDARARSTEGPVETP